MKFFVKAGVIASLCTSLFFTQESTEVKAATKDPFANYMQMSDYASVNKYRVINKVMYFQPDGDNGRYTRAMNPKRVNPYVRSQIYNTTVTLLHGKYFTGTSYLPKNGNIPSRAFVTFSPSEAFDLAGNPAFQYMFYDEQTGTYNSHITLKINRLWIQDVSELQKDHAEFIYKAKLENTIKALIDKKYEKPVFDFVFSEYLKSAKRQTADGTVKTKTFGNIKVTMKKDMVNTYYFSYVKKP